MVSKKTNITTPVTSELDAKGIPYRFFRHSGTVHSLDQAAQERGQQPEQVIRSIVFRLSAGEFIIVLVSGPRRISWSALRKYLHQSRLTMASEQEIKNATGYPLGAVSPFGLPKPLRILVDKSVFQVQAKEISIGSGVRYSTVIMKLEDLNRALGDFELVHFCKED